MTARAAGACRSTARTACTASRATSRSRTPTRSPGCRRRAARDRTTRVCDRAPGERLARLEREIGQGELSADASQRMVAQRLDRLRSALLQAHTPAKRLRNGFRRLLGRPLQSAPAGLYLWGGVGRGKTLLMDHFVASLDGLVPLQRTHFYRFMHSVHAQLKLLAGRPDPLAAVTAAMSESVQVLCLDEFLVADIGDAMILSGLLTGLLRAGITLVTTSNLAPAELYRGGLQRERFLPAIELLEQRLEVVELQGDIDYRLRLLEAAPGLFRIEGPDTPAEFESLLHLLGGNPSPAPGTIEIEGRSIAVRGLGPSVAWFEFDALCEGP